MLVITNDGRKIGLDQRLIDSTFPDEEGSKVNLCVNNVYDIYQKNSDKKSTQCIFCDMSTPKADSRQDRFEVYRPNVSKELGYELVRRKIGLGNGDEDNPRNINTFADVKGYIDRHSPEQSDKLSEGDIVVIRRPDIGEGKVYSQAAIFESGKLNDLNSVELLERLAMSDIEDMPPKEFNVYDDIKNKLMEKGVPEKQIAFIHDYDTAEKKQKLFDMMNNGDVRILIGSTAKCGAGMNAQRKMIALHHLDCPLRPSDMQQRDGRIERQGNENPEVDIFRYVTNKSFDSYLFQILENNHKVTNKKLTYSKTLSLPYKYQGLAGRVTYAFKDTYFAEFNMGYNGSENFAKGHRFGFFPAYAVGWMISNEKFWEPILPVVSELKLKASYGSVGNDAIGGDRWIYQSTISTNNGWNYGENGSEGGGGIQVGNVENLNVSWEKAYKTNLGFEMRLFDRIKIQADYFHEKREGVFINRQGLPAIVGLTTKPKTNIGASVNRGVDATLEYEEKVGEVFLTGRANFTFNRNKLLNNDEVEHLYKYQNSIGKTFGTGGNHTFGLIAEGLFQSQEEIDNAPEQNFGTYRVGDVRYRDVNGDGVVDTYDKVALGYTNIPEITYGFGLTAQWRSWDINAFFQGIAHCTFYIGGTAMRPFSTGNINQSAINADIYDHVWKTTNTPEQNQYTTIVTISKMYEWNQYGGTAMP